MEGEDSGVNRRGAKRQIRIKKAGGEKFPNQTTNKKTPSKQDTEKIFLTLKPRFQTANSDAKKSLGVSIIPLGATQKTTRCQKVLRLANLATAGKNTTLSRLRNFSTRRFFSKNLLGSLL